MTGVAPALAVTAGVGFVILQVLATGLHLNCGEAKVIGLHLALIVLAAAATWLATTT